MSASPDALDLPEPLRALLDRWIERAGLAAAEAAVVRADLEAHFR